MHPMLKRPLCKKHNSDKSEEFDVEMDHVPKTLLINQNEEGKFSFFFQGLDTHQLSILLPVCLYYVLVHEPEINVDHDHDEIEEDEVDMKVPRSKLTLTIYDDGTIGIEPFDGFEIIDLLAKWNHLSI
ncbi:hypothetical protein QVD17_17693 [Tagetes erecta]|uniref:Uncharacterized protein n=1 Tax=Tagetes erecta TaxID=13708 RepID=A0AAD8P0H3_TARER|nr:hypothetical protein QVD17_17693 [Tagetes erecta]